MKVTNDRIVELGQGYVPQVQLDDEAYWYGIQNIGGPTTFVRRVHDQRTYCMYRNKDDAEAALERARHWVKASTEYRAKLQKDLNKLSEGNTSKPKLKGKVQRG